MQASTASVSLKSSRNSFFSEPRAKTLPEPTAWKLVLLVAAAGDVVGEDPPGAGGVGGLEVVAGEQRDDGETLHRHRQVVADQQ